MTRLSLRRPDDWHLHLRDGARMRSVLPFTVERFGRAIVMPNLTPPVITVADATAYRARILSAIPAGQSFQPLMTLFLTEQTQSTDIDAAEKSGIIFGVKLYPAGATTHSDAGVRAIERVYAVLERMAEVGLPLLVHGEVMRADVDVFEREARFIDEVLMPVTQRFSSLKVVLEHVTTRKGVEF